MAAAKAWKRGRVRPFELLVALAQIPRSPIQLAQAIEDRAFDAVLRIAGEGDIFSGVELLGRIEQAQHAGVNQIVQIDMNGQGLMNTDCDCPDERKILHDDPVALLYFYPLASDTLRTTHFDPRLAF